MEVLVVLFQKIADLLRMGIAMLFSLFVTETRDD
jgi:hypothetical protein